MKKLFLFLFTIISLSAFGQSGSQAVSGIKYRVNDSTTYRSAAAAAHAQGYADIYWNNQATTPHFDIWNGASYDHVFDFNAGSGGSFTPGQLENVNVTGTTYTITEADAGKMLHLTNASGCLVTLDSDISADLIFNFRRDEGAGVTTFQSDGTSIINLEENVDSPTLETEGTVCSWVTRGTEDFDGFGQLGTGSSGLTVSSTTITSGTDTYILRNTGGVLGEYAISGTGNVAMTTNPVFTTPNLGTPSAINLANATNFSVLQLGGLGTNVATMLATFSSSNIAAAATDETGTGSLVFAGSPAFTGNPTAPTQTAGNNSTRIATTAYVDAAVTGGSVADGDKGDITVSASGATWTIDNNAVTNAKINDVALSKITGLGTGIATALAINTGSAGAPVLFNGAGGTPSSITLTNATSYPAATETTSGISEVATQAETDGFTDDVRQVTPLKLHTNLKRRSTKTANFSIASSDAGATLDANASSVITCTVDAMSTGDQVFITNRGTANVNFAAGSGVSISGLSALKPGFACVIDYNASGSATVYGGDASQSGMSVLYNNFNAVSNSSSTETDLFSYTMPAGTLGSNGETIEGIVAGTFAATANNKRLRVKIGATTVFDSGSLAITSATDWSLSYTLIRVSDTSQKCVGTLTLSNTTTQSFTDYSTAAETLSVSNIVKVTGQGTASSDLTGEFTKIKKGGF
jgi:hypothetical protein